MNSVFYRTFRRCNLLALYSKYASCGTSLRKWSCTGVFSLYLCNLHDVYKPNLYFMREKYTKRTQSAEDSSDSEEEEDNLEEDVLGRAAKAVTVKVGSLRTDLLIKSGLGIARNKVENLFYESKIRVNGKKILKKSSQAHIGDEIDVIRGLSPQNPDFLVVSRIEILSVKAGEENITVKLRRFKSLVIENYSEPWKNTVQD